MSRFASALAWALVLAMPPAALAQHVPPPRPPAPPPPRPVAPPGYPAFGPSGFIGNNPNTMPPYSPPVLTRPPSNPYPSVPTPANIPLYGSAPGAVPNAAGAATAPVSPARPAPVVRLLPAGPERAEVVVVLPDADAEVWFNGQKTTTPGERRVFKTPPLEQGSEYGYKVRAVWKQGGQVMREERQVRVTPGLTATVDFTRPAPPAKGGPAPK